MMLIDLARETHWPFALMVAALVLGFTVIMVVRRIVTVEDKKQKELAHEQLKQLERLQSENYRLKRIESQASDS